MKPVLYPVLKAKVGAIASVAVKAINEAVPIDVVI